jgi:protein transport protein SEC61 subunit gamma-like protein
VLLLTDTRMDSVLHFFRDGSRLLNRCTKPDKTEFVRICKVVGLGVAFMGGMGAFVKLTFGMLLRSPAL